MFNADAIKRAMEENELEQKKLKQIIIPKGFHILTLHSVEYKKSKNGDPQFVLTIKKAEDKDEKFRPVTEYLTIMESGLTTKKGVNISVYQLLLFFANAFKYTVTPPDADDPYGDVEKQLKQFEGKQFRGVIAHKMELMSNSSKAFCKSELVLNRCTDLADTSLNEKTVDPAQYFTDLSPKDKATLRGEVSGDTKKKSGPPADDHGVPFIGDDDENPDKLPF